MKNIKFCPKCNQPAPSEKNTFCPFDATPLIEMQPVQTTATIKVTASPQIQSSQTTKNDVIQIDCGACKSVGSMRATQIPKFSGIVRFIGNILLIPSFIGFVLALLTFLFSLFAARDTGSGAFLGIGTVFSLMIGVVSLVGGLIGWILIMDRNVYKCKRCGFILDRA